MRFVADAVENLSLREARVSVCTNDRDDSVQLMGRATFRPLRRPLSALLSREMSIVPRRIASSPAKIAIGGER